MLTEIFSIDFWRSRRSSSESSSPRLRHYAEVEVSFTNHDGNVLAGTLTVPHSVFGKSCTVAILVHGSGKMDRNEDVYGHKPFAVFAHDLSENGIAVLRFDKRGIGASQGDYDSATTLDFAEDVVAAVEYIKNDPHLGAAKIVLVGHSEGGMIAARVANRSKDVDAVIMLAAPATRGDELMLAQIAYNGRTNNLGDEVTEAQVALAKKCYGLLDEHFDNAQAIARIEALIAANAGVVDGQEYLLARIDASKITSNWYRTFLSYDPRSALRALRCPVLAVHGLNDRQVMAADQLPEMRAALALSVADYSVVEVRGVNHIMQNSLTGATSEYAGIKQTVDPQVLGLVRNFIQCAFTR